MKGNDYKIVPFPCQNKVSLDLDSFDKKKYTSFLLSLPDKRGGNCLLPFILIRLN